MSLPSTPRPLIAEWLRHWVWEQEVPGSTPVGSINGEHGYLGRTGSSANIAHLGGVVFFIRPPCHAASLEDRCGRCPRVLIPSKSSSVHSETPENTSPYLAWARWDPIQGSVASLHISSSPGTQVLASFMRVGVLLLMTV